MSDCRHNPRAQLRKALYRAIRAAVDRVPLWIHRTVVVEVLATMAAEQAAIVAKEQQTGKDVTRGAEPMPS